MDLYTIWVIDGTVEPWVIGAWDAASIDVNYEGYEAALADAYRDHGKDNVRVIKSNIDYNAVVDAFRPRVDSATLTGVTPVDAG